MRERVEKEVKQGKKIYIITAGERQGRGSEKRKKNKDKKKE